MKLYPVISLLGLLSFSVYTSAVPFGQNGTQSLRSCVQHALTGSDASQRIVDPSSDTYTDARMGEKIQLVATPNFI